MFETRSGNTSSAAALLSAFLPHSHWGTHPCIPAVHLALVNTTYLPQMVNDCPRCNVCSQQGRLIAHMILELKWLTAWRCFLSCCSKKREKHNQQVCQGVGLLTIEVTMDICPVLETCPRPSVEIEDHQWCFIWFMGRVASQWPVSWPVIMLWNHSNWEKCQQTVERGCKFEKIWLGTAVYRAVWNLSVCVCVCLTCTNNLKETRGGVNDVTHESKARGMMGFEFNVEKLHRVREKIQVCRWR